MIKKLIIIIFLIITCFSLSSCGVTLSKEESSSVEKAILNLDSFDGREEIFSVHTNSSDKNQLDHQAEVDKFNKGDLEIWEFY